MTKTPYKWQTPKYGGEDSNQETNYKKHYLKPNDLKFSFFKIFTKKSIFCKNKTQYNVFREKTKTAIYCVFGGKSGIRTRVPVARQPHFECGSL